MIYFILIIVFIIGGCFIAEYPAYKRRKKIQACLAVQREFLALKKIIKDLEREEAEKVKEWLLK